MRDGVLTAVEARAEVAWALRRARHRTPLDKAARTFGVTPRVLGGLEDPDEWHVYTLSLMLRAARAYRVPLPDLLPKTSNPGLPRTWTPTRWPLAPDVEAHVRGMALDAVSRHRNAVAALWHWKQNLRHTTYFVPRAEDVLDVVRLAMVADLDRTTLAAWLPPSLLPPPLCLPSPSPGSGASLPACTSAP
jgi:hypothetical protein